MLCAKMASFRSITLHITLMANLQRSSLLTQTGSDGVSTLVRRYVAG